MAYNFVDLVLASIAHDATDAAADDDIDCDRKCSFN